MTYRITDKSLNESLEMLNRYTEPIKFEIEHYNGYCHLISKDGNKKNNVSNGNTTRELYYQIITACNILGELKN